jgi:hypothetical protein
MTLRYSKIDDSLDKCLLTSHSHSTQHSSFTTRVLTLFFLACVILPVAPMLAATDCVVLGDEGILLRDGSAVVSGDVGANVASCIIDHYSSYLSDHHKESIR